VGLPDSLFGQFGETARCRDAQHGDGVCCAFAPQLVVFYFHLLLIFTPHALRFKMIHNAPIGSLLRYSACVLHQLTISSIHSLRVLID